MQRYELFAVYANNQSKNIQFLRFNWFKASIQHNLSVHTSPNNMPDKVISIYMSMYIVYTWTFILYILELLYYIYLSNYIIYTWAMQEHMKTHFRCCHKIWFIRWHKIKFSVFIRWQRINIRYNLIFIISNCSKLIL